MAAPARTHPSRRPRPRPGTGGRGLSWPLWTSGWALLPLRLFLGVTFLYAGLQKFADPRFLRAGAPGSVQAQLHAAVHTSPIGSHLGGLASHALVVGVAIALAEVAVGVGTLIGLWARAAAAAGLALSLGFLLTVSWHSHPYYLGPDVVFAAAWVPLVLAGAGEDPRLSLDALLRRRAQQELGLPATATVPMPFATVQALCGGYQPGADACRYRHGAPCRPEACPVLADPPAADPRAGDTLDRRTFLRRAQVAGLFVAAGLGTAAATARIGRLLSGSRGQGDAVTSLSAPGASPGGATTTTSPRAGAPGAVSPGGVAIGPASAVPVGGVAAFTDPGAGDPAYVVQPAAGRFQAFSAVCPHAGCRVQHSGGGFVCPCHGARFDGTGSLLQGPATRSLSAIPVTKGADGQLYVEG
jgi:thiosulfate dehydrogenase [quinone] large subunit